MKEAYSNRYILPSKRSFFSILLLVFILFSFRSFAQKTSWVTPKGMENVKNPIAGDNSSLAVTKTVYLSYCAPCHGDKGRGNGPAAAGLNPKPADHTSATIQSETDGSLYWKLTEGRNPMPGYKKIFPEQQRWELINFIRSLAGKK